MVDKLSCNLFYLRGDEAEIQFINFSELLSSLLCVTKIQQSKIRLTIVVHFLVKGRQFFHLTNYYSGDRIKNNEMGVERDIPRMVRGEVCTGFWWRNMRERATGRTYK